MDDSSEVVDISCSISCLCPLSFSKVQIPTRGRNCRHLQFFDKSSFLELYGNRGYGPCPICLNEITISDLVVDPYIQHLLDTSSPDQKRRVYLFSISRNINSARVLISHKSV